MKHQALGTLPVVPIIGGRIMRLYKIVTGLTLGTLALFFQNCGQPGNIGMEGHPVGVNSFADGAPTVISVPDVISEPEDSQPPPPPVAAPPSTEVTVEQQIKSCETLLAQNKLSSVTKKVRFEDTKTESKRTQVCEFNKGDNLTTLDHYLRARYAQNAKVSLPANAVICDIEVESTEQSFQYDDVFFLTYNNAILASNHKSQIKKALVPEIATHTKTKLPIEIYNYDWLKIRNTYFENIVNDFCLGEDQKLSSCDWPVSQKYGKIKLKFDPELLIRISQKRNVTDQSLGFVITGDNDPNSDCYHQRLDLDLKIKYFLK